MFRIVDKRELNSMVTLLEIEAPFVAKKAQAGQFIIFRVDEFSERVPLTIADYDREKGTVTIIFQKVGLSTKMLAAKEIGDTIQDFVGPLGVATEYDGMKKVAVVGGGVGCAIAYPQAKALHNLGVEVDVIAGFRNKDIVPARAPQDKSHVRNWRSKGHLAPLMRPTKFPESRSPSRGTLRFSGTPSSEPFLPS